MIKKTLLAITIFMISFVAHALEMPEIFSDNMMLQQNTEAKIWGWASPGSVVEVTVSWNNQKIYRTANANGRWDVEVKTPKASYDLQSVVIKECEAKGKKVIDSKTINNVLIGEVWFCSGQSNMEMPLGGFWNCPVEGANEVIAQAGRYKNSIRVVTIDKHGTAEPQDRVKGQWQICEPKNAGGFSACGYFFAQTLTDLIDVPVGIVSCAWGGSCVEGWLPKEILETYPDGLVPFSDFDYMQKMVMYNGMLHPLAGYTVKGFLWNQGESNIGRENEYADRFKTMVNLWRKMWNQPGDKLPIYTVELPPYWYDDVNGQNGPKFRDVQHKIAHELANSGCVCTSDLIYDYEPMQIHGTKKKEIGQRLAYMAAVRDYGVEGVAAEAPEFEYMTECDASNDDNTVIAGSKVQSPDMKGQVSKVYQLYFTNAQDGFDRMTDIEGFEAQDENGNWYPAVVWSSSAWQNVERVGCFLKLACPQAKEVKAIRYCYKNFVKGSLHNMRGLPVVPFTTEK